jgi:phytoene synthase
MNRQAEAITAASGSNLALALRVLPHGRRNDMRVFYAFCRVVDDLADEPALPMERRRAGLRAWRTALEAELPTNEDPPLAAALRSVLFRYQVPRSWALEVISGCEMDLEGTRYKTWDELHRYCYRVASAVGLVSARIFGGKDCERYAEELGLALQLTNILRDAAEDFSVSGRIYFPEEDLKRFGIEPGSWVRSEPAGWRALMEFQVARARGHYAAAVAALPRSERRVMVAAEIMRKIYGTLLDQMERDGFRIWERQYKLSSARKACLAATMFVRTVLLTAGQTNGASHK